MRNSGANNNRSNSGAYSGSGGGQNAGYNNYRGNRGGSYNNRGAMNNMSGFNRGGFQQPMAGGFQGSGMGGYQGTPMGGMQSYGGFQGRGGMAGGMRGGTMGMRGGRGGMNASPMMGMPMGGMGMGGIGAMGMNMPQMGGGMGMQGMTGSHSQPQVNSPHHYGPSAIPTGHAGSSVAQQQQYPSRSIVGGLPPAAPATPGGNSHLASSNPSSAWASYTQYSRPPSNSPASQSLFHLPSPTPVSPPQPSAALNQWSSNAGTQTHFNPAFFSQGQQSGGTGDANWNPHGAKRTRQE